MGYDVTWLSRVTHVAPMVAENSPDPPRKAFCGTAGRRSRSLNAARTSRSTQVGAHSSVLGQKAGWDAAKGEHGVEGQHGGEG